VPFRITAINIFEIYKSWRDPKQPLIRECTILTWTTRKKSLRKRKIRSKRKRNQINSQ